MLHCKFSRDYNSGRIFKIGQYLTKLGVVHLGFTFFGPPCICDLYPLTVYCAVQVCSFKADINFSAVRCSVCCISDAGVYAGGSHWSHRVSLRGRGMIICCWFLLPRNALYCICAVLLSHVVCPSVCDVGDLWSHRLEILETNCMGN